MVEILLIKVSISFYDEGETFAAVFCCILWSIVCFVYLISGLKTLFNDNNLLKEYVNSSNITMKELEDEYKTAKKIGSIYIGKRHIFSNDSLGVVVVPINSITKLEIVNLGANPAKLRNGYYYLYIYSNISDKKRIVIKLGTSTLAHKTGKLNIRRMTNLVRVISDLHNSGREIILVSSGAVGLGAGKLGLPEKPKDTRMKQAVAAIGQCELMHIYDDMFEKYSVTVAQILLTKTIIENPDHSKNFENTIETLVSMGVIPIVNENDTIAIDELELEIGENDSLSAIVASLSKADLLLILSDIDGLYDDDPRRNPDAKPIYVVEEITPEIERVAGGAGSSLGTGGMSTKIHAAKIAGEAGIDMVIMNGKNPEILYELFEDKEIGTIFKANK